MKSKLTKFAQMAALGLALTFTLSCSGGDDNGGGTSSPSGGGGNTALDGTWRRDDGNYYYQIDINSNNWVFLEGSAGVSQEVVKGTWSSNTEIAIPSTGTLTLTITHTKNSNGWNDFPPEYSSVKTNTATYNINASGNLLTLSNPALVVDVWSKLQGAYTKGGSGGGSSSSVTGGSSSSSATTSGEVAASETVVIGGKTWMTKNLDVNVQGSKCYAEGVSGVSADSIAKNCAKYGRLYNWATAMKLPSKCNSTLSTSDADCTIRIPYHQGICPDGWHIPSNADWDNLYRSVDGTSGTDSPYGSPTAGRDLKAKDGWNGCGPSGSGKTYLCEDTKGFAALPGGQGGSAGSFYYAGTIGNWWSANEHDANANYAYKRDIYVIYEDAEVVTRDKSILYSVRCVKD
jgi:uncharacterized protein (TIGR02145 family)